ncbi:MAG: hypothetical protein Q9178_006014 [Gyalolechia marmorata]
MGQRHQLFVIAKINGRYRTLCAVHHQWLYGHTAVKRCLGSLKIFQDPGNRVPLQQELLIAKDREESLWPEDPPELGDHEEYIHFPFIATCLTLGASFGREGYHHGVSVEPFYMQYDQGDNNNGITIFDITDLERVCYCFVDYNGMESEREVQLMAPLSGRTYLAAYYDLDEVGGQGVKEQMMLNVGALDKYPLILTSTLQETWPEGEWENPEVDAVLAQSPGTNNLGDITDTLGAVSLRETAMDPLLHSLIKPSNDGLALLSELEFLPDFVPKLKRKVYDAASSLELTPTLVVVLNKVLGSDADVDLSPFTNFSASDLSIVVKALQDRSAMTGLNLSNRPELTESDLETILGSNPVCKRLYLLGNPQISTHYLTAQLGGYEHFHSDLFCRALIDEGNYRFNQFEGRPMFDFSRSNHLSEVVWIGITEDIAIKARPIDYNDMIHVISQGSFGAGYGSRHSFQYHQHPVDDIPVSGGKAMKGLLKLLQWIRSHEGGFTLPADITSAIGCAFATLSSAETSFDAVAAISTSLNTYPRRNSSPKPQAAPRCLKNNEWSVVVVYDAFDSYLFPPKDDDDDAKKASRERTQALKKVRYVFVTPVADVAPQQKRFLVADAPKYIKEVLGKDDRTRTEADLLIEVWNQHFPTTQCEFYAEDDIHDILEKVYPRLEEGSKLNEED